MNLTRAQAMGLLSGAEQVNSRGFGGTAEPGGFHHGHKNLDEEIIKLRKTGLDARETAERLAIHVNTVWKCMRRHGLGRGKL